MDWSFLSNTVFHLALFFSLSSITAHASDVRLRHLLRVLQESGKWEDRVAVINEAVRIGRGDTVLDEMLVLVSQNAERFDLDTTLEQAKASTGVSLDGPRIPEFNLGYTFRVDVTQRSPLSFQVLDRILSRLEGGELLSNLLGFRGDGLSCTALRLNDEFLGFSDVQPAEAVVLQQIAELVRLRIINEMNRKGTALSETLGTSNVGYTVFNNAVDWSWRLEQLEVQARDQGIDPQLAKVLDVQSIWESYRAQIMVIVQELNQKGERASVPQELWQMGRLNYPPALQLLLEIARSDAHRPHTRLEAYSAIIRGDSDVLRDEVAWVFEMLELLSALGLPTLQSGYLLEIGKLLGRLGLEQSFDPVVGHLFEGADTESFERVHETVNFRLKIEEFQVRIEVDYSDYEELVLKLALQLSEEQLAPFKQVLKPPTPPQWCGEMFLN